MNRYLYGMISFALSIIMWLLIFKFLYYKMNGSGVLSFYGFEVISIVLAMIPLLLGIISLVRNEKLLIISIIGIGISVLALNNLYSMAILSTL